MSRAKISINAVDATIATVPIGVSVQLSNDNGGGEVSYAWTILDQPPGTADVLSNPAIQNPTFTPTKEGSYLVRLVVDATLGSEAQQTAIVAVADARTGERVPAAAETLEASSTRGWAAAQNSATIRSLRTVADSNVITAITPGGLGIGAIVNLGNLGAINTGTQAAASLPKILAATGSEGHARGELGVIIDGVAAGVLTAGKAVYVRRVGVAPTTITANPAPAVLSPVYLGDTGLPSLTPGTYPRIVGRVIASDNTAHTYNWWFTGGDGGYRIDRRITTPAAMYPAPSDWTRSGETGVGPWHWEATGGGSDPLVIQLMIAPGEVLARVDLRHYQDEATGTLTVSLSIGGQVASGGQSTGPASLTTPDATGDHVFTPAFADLPLQLGANQCAWLTVVTSAGTGLRRVLNATAYVIPPSD
jgi:hypothetical protein